MNLPVFGIYFMAALLLGILPGLILTLLIFVKKCCFTAHKVKGITAASSLLSIAAVYFVYNFYRDIIDASVNILIIISMGLLILFNISLTVIFINRSEAEAVKQRLIFAENQIYNNIEHYNELYTAGKETRKIWHDMNNRLAAIAGYIDKNEYKKALDYINNLIGDISKINSIVNTGCPAIDSILRYKIKQAGDNGCYIDYQVLLPAKVYVDELDMAMISGNALDNAIEYLQKREIKKREIKYNLTAYNEYISIVIVNEVSEALNVNSLITSKPDSKYHGYGLDTIRSIAVKYEGDVDISCENKFFRVSILLRNTDPKLVSSENEHL